MNSMRRLGKEYFGHFVSEARNIQFKPFNRQSVQTRKSNSQAFLGRSMFINSIDWKAMVDHDAVNVAAITDAADIGKTRAALRLDEPKLRGLINAPMGCLQFNRITA